MRSILRGTLLLTAFMLVCLGAAWAGGPESSTGNSMPLLTQPPALGSRWEIRTNPYRLPTPRVHSPSRRMSETVCYTMRTYLMARDDQTSDATRQVGYTTCQPESQYQLRFSDEVGESPSQ